MTQNEQEYLNEIFLGKEDPDLAFKPMTNNLKEALIKDFRQLYQKEFTTDWEVQRMVRELEVGVMSLDNVEALINQKEKEHKLEAYLEIDLLVAEQEQRYETLEYTELHQDLDQRIKQLKEELNKEVL